MDRTRPMKGIWTIIQLMRIVCKWAAGRERGVQVEVNRGHARLCFSVMLGMDGRGDCSALIPYLKRILVLFTRTRVVIFLRLLSTIWSRHCPQSMELRCSDCLVFLRSICSPSGTRRQVGLVSNLHSCRSRVGCSLFLSIEVSLDVNHEHYCRPLLCRCVRDDRGTLVQQVAGTFGRAGLSGSVAPEFSL